MHGAFIAAAALAIAVSPADAHSDALTTPTQSIEVAQTAYTCRGSDGYGQDFGGRRTYLWRPQWLETIAADAKRRAAIIEQANQALGRGPYMVTDKGSLVPGATANHYTSIGPYWWPDPDQPDGLPYRRRDGEVNPERNGPNFDKDRLRALGHDAEALSLAYFLTQEPRYAEHLARQLSTWFLDPKTRMLPNMDFAQGIPGRVNGRGEGIIEASDLSTVIESAGLIAPSGALSEADQAGLRMWFARFSEWLATSKNGQAHRQKTNNHGVFFDFYLAHFSLFAGMDNVTSILVRNFPEARLAPQMDNEGRFPEELKRTRSWHYSNYIVAGAGRLATIGECVSEDLWNSALDDGRNLSLTFKFLDRYGDNLNAWPFEDRDLKAGRLDRMQRTHALVGSLFARGENFAPDAELP